MPISGECPVCRRQAGAPCAECRELFAPLGSLPPPPGLDGLIAACWYQEAARPLVAGLKYRDQRATVSFLAGLMADALGRVDGAATVTWAPTTPHRRRQRGFDHAELLARAVARRLRLRCRGLLVRVGGEAQTGRGGSDRRRDPPRFRTRRRTTPDTVLLVDDVVTTGTTLASAARTLRAGGSTSVVALVAAATPPPDAPGN